MGIEFSWEVEGHIVLVHLYDKITDNDLILGEAISNWMRESDTVWFHITFDATDVTGIGVKVNQMLSRLKYLNDPKMGCAVVYGMPGMFEAFIRLSTALVTQLTGARIRSVDNRNKALEFIYEFDSTLE